MHDRCGTCAGRRRARARWACTLLALGRSVSRPLPRVGSRRSVQRRVPSHAFCPWLRGVCGAMGATGVSAARFGKGGGRGRPAASHVCHRPRRVRPLREAWALVHPGASRHVPSKRAPKRRMLCTLVASCPSLSPLAPSLNALHHPTPNTSTYGKRRSSTLRARCWAALTSFYAATRSAAG